MAHRHTSFRKEWLRKTDSNDVICSLWVEQYDESTAYCRLCDQKINVKSQGFSAINQHSKGKHHKLKSQSLQNNNHVNVHEKSPASTTGTRNLKQQVLFPIKIAQPDTPEPAIVSGPSIFSATTMSTERKPCNIKDSATTAECLWGFKTAHANYSFNSSKGLPNLLKRMAPDSLILDKFRMSPGKVSYLLGYGLGPEVLRMAADKIASQQKDFTLHFDETTTSQIKKQFDLQTRFFDDDFVMFFCPFIFPWVLFN